MTYKIKQEKELLFKQIIENLFRPTFFYEGMNKWGGTHSFPTFPTSVKDWVWLELH